MKKNILKATIVAAFALIAGMNVYNAQKSDIMSGLALANVEALAGCEWNSWIGEPVFHITLTGYCSWSCSRGGVFQCPV